MINYVCKELNVDPGNLEERQRVEVAIKNDVATWLKDKQRKTKVKVTLDLQELPLELFPQGSRLPGMFSEVLDYRNDINHAGMRKDLKKPQDIKDKLHKLVAEMNRELLAKR
jgi:hypothetical protein